MFNTHLTHNFQIEFCLKEWETGAFVSKNLNEFDLKKGFSGHLKSVASWDALVPEVTERIRQKIFDNLQYAIQYLLQHPGPHSFI